MQTRNSIFIQWAESENDSSELVIHLQRASSPSCFLCEWAPGLFAQSQRVYVQALEIRACFISLIGD